jgi:hypothetical protein
LQPAGIQVSLDLLVPEARPKLVEPVSQLGDLRRWQLSDGSLDLFHIHERSLT